MVGVVGVSDGGIGFIANQSELCLVQRTRPSMQCEGSSD